MEALLGGLLGGVFRMLPEFLKWLDRRGERDHERQMFDKQIEADKLRSSQSIEETKAAGEVVLDSKGLDALIAAIKGQAQLTGNKLVDGFNALMRPLITFQWVILLYPAAIVAEAYLLYSQHGVPAAAAILQVFGPEEKAICSGIINFWFLDRVIKKSQ